MSKREYSPDEYVKITNGNRMNYGFFYKEGKNEDKHGFDPHTECGRGGLYFCRFANFHKWVNYYDSDCLIWRVSLSKKEHIIDYGEKLKAHTIYLSDPYPVYSDPELRRIAIENNGLTLKHIPAEEQTEDLCISAIRHNTNAVVFVADQTPKICRLALSADGILLKHIKEQTEQLCLQAVTQNGLALKYAKFQTAEICLKAVGQNGLALEYVAEQTPTICERAVGKNGLALEYVVEQTPAICEKAVRQNAKALRFVIEQTEELCQMAVSTNPHSIFYVKNQNDRLQEIATTKEPSLLDWFDCGVYV